MTPGDRRYSTEHEWALLDGSEVVVGITEFAQDQLGDVVYVELPAVGSRVRQGEPMGVIESVKAASDLFSPVTGEVVAQNGAIEKEPQQVNDSPYGEGWLIRVRPDDPQELDNLLPAERYETLIQGQEA